MSKRGRNEPCSCGSGKKFKHCCLGEEQASISPFSSYSSSEVLKVLALLRVEPRNHGKYIRLDETTLDILRNTSYGKEESNIDQLRSDLLLYCIPNVHEDPPEDFFTEIVYWRNGNNLVFPGIAGDGVQILQGLLDTIHWSDNFPSAFLQEVEPAITFLLSIHNRIALALGYSARMFEDEHHEPLFIPGNAEIEKGKQLFSFHTEELNVLLAEFGVSVQVFENFVFIGDKKKLDFTNRDNNPIFQKPFVLIGNEYILVDPTAQLFCLNDFILSTAQKHSCLDELLRRYRNTAMTELYPVFARMGWDPVLFKFPLDESMPQSSLLTELLFTADSNRLVYVTMMTETALMQTGTRDEVMNSSREFQIRSEKMAALIKAGYPDHELLLLHVTHKSRILARMGLALNLLEGVNYHLFFSFQELFLLSRKWKFDKLSLWKYAKYLHEYENKHKFAPFNTHYSKMKWYMEHEGSFYHPDNAPSTLSFFGFEIESEERRSGIELVDKRAVPYFFKSKILFIPCYRKEVHFPVYISQDVNNGGLASCLQAYDCPIWCISSRENDFTAEVYINGILYWLNEMEPLTRDWMNQLGPVPIVLNLTLGKDFYLTGGELKKILPEEVKFKFNVNHEERQAELYISSEFRHFLCSADNRGECILMNFVIDVIGELKLRLGSGGKMEEDLKHKIFQSIMPNGPKKYINTITDYRDLTLSLTDVQEPRLVPKADVSHILQNQLSGLGMAVPPSIPDPKNQTALLNELVKFHYNTVKQEVQAYDGLSLLIFLMKRQESILQDHAFRQVNYPIKQACLGHYYDVFDEFYQTAKEGNQANLALRILIEWVACWMPSGNKPASDEDTDMLLARVSQVLNYGALSDEIEYKLREVEMGLLPSGRLGIDRKKNKETFEEIGSKIFGAEYESFGEKFSEYFESTRRPSGDATSRKYIDRVDKVFKEEWGIAIHDVFVLSHALVQKMLGRGQSVALLSRQELYAMLIEASFTSQEIAGWLSILQFIKRSDVLKAPKGFNKEEVYPWRYNRRLSYLLKPLIFIEKDGIDHVLISARHLYKAAENIVSIFHTGQLPLDKESKLIRQLLAECNGMKGAEFREQIYLWLCANTEMQVYSQEITIKLKGYFLADIDKGDIDILAIDHIGKIVYSIECKNTSQSKMAYEFHLEIMEYLGTPEKIGLIQKHVNRHAWLVENQEQVFRKLSLTPDYQIISLVISNHVLPTASLRVVPLPVISFYELKKNGMPVLQKQNETV